MKLWLTDKAKKEFSERISSVVESLYANGCPRQEIFAFCLKIAPNLLMEIYQHQEGNGTNMGLHPEQIVATIIGETMKDILDNK